MPDALGPAPWQRPTPVLVDGINKLMLGAAEAVAALPNQLWGLIILLVGAAMIPTATEKTLAIIGGIITAGGNLLLRREAKKPNGDG